MINRRPAGPDRNAKSTAGQAPRAARPAGGAMSARNRMSKEEQWEEIIMNSVGNRRTRRRTRRRGMRRWTKRKLRMRKNRE
eukprot:4907229-Pyramimonas_sp.AAC.1